MISSCRSSARTTSLLRLSTSACGDTERSLTRLHSRPLPSRSYCQHDGDPLVRIHGNWCGPNWTGGQAVSAQDYQGSWNASAVDRLDQACREHDKQCGTSSRGCSRSSDDKLLQEARRISANPWYRITNREMARAADTVIAVISIARATREW